VQVQEAGPRDVDRRDLVEGGDLLGQLGGELARRPRHGLRRAERDAVA
jgi:hypothetical protein